MTEQEMKELKDFLGDKLTPMGSKLVVLEEALDTIKGQYDGDPAADKEKLEEQIAELKDDIEELKSAKPGTVLPTDDAYDEIYGKGTEALGLFGQDVARWAIAKEIGGSVPERLVQYRTVQDEQEKAATGMSEGIGSDGGFLIPRETAGGIMELVEMEAQLLPLIVNFPMSSNSLDLTYRKVTDNSGGTWGGVRMYYGPEAPTMTATDPDIAQTSWKLYDLFGLAYATNDLIEDSPVSIGPWLEEEFKKAAAMQMDYDIVNGSGAGQPQGILNSPALESVAAETNQEAATIVAQNVMKMWAKMPARNRRTAVWLTNQECLPQLMQMTIAVGTGGIPVWLPANGLANQPYDTLLGGRLIITEMCQALGTAGDLIYWDPRSYRRGYKSSGMSFATSIHVQFITDQTAFRFKMRHDAKCPWPSALTPRHGSADLSPMIAIATRS
jgi:HK97 family phage major capsid protein